MNYYKGIVLLESLADTTILEQVEVVGVDYKDEPTATDEQPNKWSWYKVRVAESLVDDYIENISKALKPRAWYTNLWKEGDYILIFPTKVFRQTSIYSEKWLEAVEHALSIGVPLEQIQPIEEILTEG